MRNVQFTVHLIYRFYLFIGNQTHDIASAAIYQLRMWMQYKVFYFIRKNILWFGEMIWGKRSQLFSNAHLLVHKPLWPVFNASLSVFFSLNRLCLPHILCKRISAKSSDRASRAEDAAWGRSSRSNRQRNTHAHTQKPNKHAYRRHKYKTL